MNALHKYLGGYPPGLIDQAQALAANGQLGTMLRKRYAQAHAVRSDRALYDYVGEIKARFMRSAPPLAKAVYDPRLQLAHQALGTHTQVSRVQGGKLTAKREIRIASLFKDAPADLLRMIVVHELAHMKERDHDKAFYALCCHMAPNYHQLEFDTRLWLAALEIEATVTAPDAGPAAAPTAG